MGCAPSNAAHTGVADAQHNTHNKQAVQHSEGAPSESGAAQPAPVVDQPAVDDSTQPTSQPADDTAVEQPPAAAAADTPTADTTQHATPAPAVDVPPSSPAPAAGKLRVSHSHSRDPNAAVAASLSPPILCDQNSTHVATLHCAECKSYFCAACDAQVHGDKNDHVRSELSETSEQGVDVETTHGNQVVLADEEDNASQTEGVNAVADQDAAASVPPTTTTTTTTAESAAPISTPGQDGDGGAAEPAAATYGQLLRRPSVSAERRPSRSRSRSKSRSTLRRHQSHVEKAADQSPRSILFTLPISRLQHLSDKDLDSIWQQYDDGEKGYLSKADVHHLAEDCLTRLMAYIEHDIRESNPHCSERQIEAELELEREHIVEGAKTKAQLHEALCKGLRSRLDIHNDNEVTKLEFRVAFKEWCEHMFESKKHVHDAACSIM